MKKAVLLTLTIGFALLAAACAPAAAPPAPGGEKPAAPTVKEKPQYGGVYRATTSNPRIGQDPHRTTGTGHFSSFGKAYSNLLRFKIAPDVSVDTFIIAPELAERWENPTPTTWIFHLRKGIKWHNVPPVNGREFVADDVVYSVNRLASPGSAQNGYWQDLERVEALDRYTLKFTLKNPVAPFLTIVAFGFNKMVAKEAVEAGGGNLDKGPLIGTGPWLVECTVDVECVLKRNPDYFLKDEDGNPLPYLDRMHLKVIPDPAANFSAFRAKQLDALGLTAEQQQIVEKSYPEVIVKDVKSFNHQFIHFRNDKAPWSDERVRMAVSKAINRQEIIDTLYGGKGWFSLGWANPAEDWFIPAEELKQAWKQDIEGAKKLLAEAGYPNGLDAEFWVPISGVYVSFAELLQAQMAKAGIRARITTHEYSKYLSRIFIRHGEFEDMAFGPQGSWMDPDLWLSAYYHSQGGRNSSYTNDPKLDSMIEAQRRELDPEKRKKLILEIQRYLLQKNYQVVVMGNITVTAWWPWLKNRDFFSAAGDYPAGRADQYFWIDQELRKQLAARD